MDFPLFASLALAVVCAALALAWIRGKKQIQQQHEQLEKAIHERNDADHFRNLCEERLTRLAAIDPLTDLPNQRYYRRQLEAEWGRSIRYERALSILILEVDDYPGIVKGLGAETAAKTLSDLALSLSQEARRMADMVCYVDSAQFAIILPEVGPEGAFKVAVRIQIHVRSLGLPAPLESKQSTLTGCIGISSSAKITPGTSFKHLDGLAHEALKAAQAQGHSKIASRIYSTEFNHQTRK